MLAVQSAKALLWTCRVKRLEYIKYKSLFLALALAFCSIQACSMIKFSAVAASLRFLEFKGKYSNRILTFGTDIALPLLTPFTPKEMFGQDIILPLQRGPLMTIINIIQILQ